jgi:hypothetical protein
MISPPPIPRAPAARDKLVAAESALAELEAEVAVLALEASEGKAGAEKNLIAHRSKIDAAERKVSEQRKAVVLAECLDRQAAANGMAKIRAEQLAEFKKQMTDREKAMAVVLAAAATMAKAYGEFSEATLAAQIAAPIGTNIPPMSIGPNGLYGNVFGRCEILIQTELWRLAPPRADGRGRSLLPFAKPLSPLSPGDPASLPPGIDEMRHAHAAILTDIEKQIAMLDQRAMAAASAPKKEAA